MGLRTIDVSGVTGSQTAALEFRVLGPIEVLRNGSVIALGGRRQAALLAVLLLERGHAVSPARLVDELWDGKPPAAAQATLRSYVTRLRRVLGDGAVIAREPGGYALRVADDTVDVGRFERLLHEGEDALARGAAHRAAERLAAALALWRGRALGDLAADGTLRHEAERLEELRLRALEARCEADLRLGRAPELVDELETVLLTQPYREGLWRQLMLALYRAGRQADAIAAYRRARARLVEDLGVEPGAELRELERAILRQEVETPTPAEHRHNLPAPLTSFIGRSVELDEIEQLLQKSRLVTLTGVGGAGKTRLALEIARRAVADFPDGVWFCDFSAVVDAALVLQQVAQALDVREQGERALDAQVRERLRRAEALLVFDNCEHLRTACAEVAHAILGTAARVRVLATSRQPLGAPGETEYAVPPLALPPAGGGSGALRSSEAVRLFLERARSVRPALRDDEATLRAAGRICIDLDGLPLAIELAAARAKALALDDIAGRLRDRFRFLVSWRRLASARHRTLREAMDWSYELLAPQERDLLARLSVFAGGFGLDGVTAVGLDGDEDGALELLERLVDASLVVVDERDGGLRYRLLETVRQYAADRLVEAGDERAACKRHADWYLALAEEAQPQLTGADQARWLRLLEHERENLAAALAYLRDTGDTDRRLRLAIAVSRFWYVRGYLAEGRQRLEEALEGIEAADPPLLRRAYTAAASLALLQGDHASAIRYAERALDEARASDDPVYVANALSNLGAISLAAGQYVRANQLLEEAVVLSRAGGDERVAALAINNLGDLALTVGEYERAEPLFEESLALLRARGDTANIARSLFNLAAVALRLGRLDDADARLRESVGFAQQAGDKEDLAWCLEGLAALAASRGDGQRAATLLGAAAELLAAMGADFKPFERQLHEETRAKALELCGAARFAEATAEGAALTLEDAVTSALSTRTRA